MTLMLSNLFILLLYRNTLLIKMVYKIRYQINVKNVNGNVFLNAN